MKGQSIDELRDDENAFHTRHNSERLLQASRPCLAANSLVRLAARTERPLWLQPPAAPSRHPQNAVATRSNGVQYSER